MIDVVFHANLDFKEYSKLSKHSVPEVYEAFNRRSELLLDFLYFAIDQ